MAGGFEHHFRRVIAGDLDSVRQRLSDVLEDFGYIVLGDTPIQAKRPRQKSIWVAMVLDYDTKLTIALKPISPASTLATFDYDIEQLFTKGEMQALEREAEAIIALATTAAPIEAFCPSCGAENSGNARFCRACGKPGARNALPSELEVMRLTALASGTQIEITL
ncbi:MAG: zinc ribbon domain-containing protein, partial [Blastocatellia bacterium]